jgi:hypothetical protein
MEMKFSSREVCFFSPRLRSCSGFVVVFGTVVVGVVSHTEGNILSYGLDVRPHYVGHFTALHHFRQVFVPLDKHVFK